MQLETSASKQLIQIKIEKVRKSNTENIIKMRWYFGNLTNRTASHEIQILISQYNKCVAFHSQFYYNWFFRCQLCVFPDVTWTDLERRFFWSIIIYLIYTIIDISSGCRHQDKQKYTITMWKPRLADVFRCKITAPFAWVTFIIYVIPTQIFQIQGKKLNVNSSIGNNTV